MGRTSYANDGKMKTLLLFIILLDACFGSITSQYYQTRKCQEQRDCPTGPDEMVCTVCADVHNSTTPKCIHVIPGVFKKDHFLYEENGKLLCFYHDEDSCDPKWCGTKGLCNIGDTITSYKYEPYCVCKPPFYGETCNKKDSINKLPLLQLVRKPIGASTVRVGERVDQVFDVYSWKVETLSYALTVDHPKNIRLNYKRFKLLLGKVEDQNLLRVRASVLFPYRVDDVIVLRGTYVGYVTNINVRVYNGQDLLYAKAFDIFVTYMNTSLKCMPLLSVSQCSKQLDTAVEFTRVNSISMDIQVMFVKDGARAEVEIDNKHECSVEGTMSWKVWRLVDGWNEKKDPDHQNDNQPRSISFPQYKVDIGTYQAVIEYNNAAAKFISTASCYFKVFCIPLEAKISGGSYRKVSPKMVTELKADPLQTSDPNQADDDQGHVRLRWSCINLIDPAAREKICEPGDYNLHQTLYVPPNTLTPGAEYEFTMMMWTNKYDNNSDCRMSPQFDKVVLDVANYTDATERTVVINCLKNCGSKVAHDHPVFLKALQSLQTEGNDNVTYEWFYFNSTEKGEVSADSISAGGLPSHSLLIKEGSLEPDTKYTIVARIKDTAWYSKYVFKTNKLDFDATCYVTPISGVKGSTFFKINCSELQNPSSNSLYFEFFDKRDQEANADAKFSGRMLGGSKDGVLNAVRLTRGNVMIYIMNGYGQYVTKRERVELTERTINASDLANMYQGVEHEIRHGSIESALESISYIPDLIPSDMGKTDMNEVLITLLRLTSKITVEKLSDMKVCVSTLTNILLTMNSPNLLQLNPHTLVSTFKVIKQQAGIFSDKVIDDMNYMSPKEVKEVSTCLLDCIQTGLACRERITENDIIDLSMEWDLLDGSTGVQHSLDMITDALSLQQASGLPATKISSTDQSIVAWVAESDVRANIYGLTAAENIPVVINDKIHDYLERKLHESENVALQIASIKENIYSWSDSQVRSKLVSVSLKSINYKGDMSVIENLKTPIDIFVDFEHDITNVTVNDATHQLDPAMDPLMLDVSIKVHRIDPVPKSLVTIQFLFPPTNSPLRVIVLDDYRPDYEMMMQKATLITEKSSLFNVQARTDGSPSFIFIGIAPGPEVPINQSVTYAFTIKTAVCKSWAKRQWSSVGCGVAKFDDSRVHCGCTHFSIFAAAFPVPPNEVDPFNDVVLFLTVFNNPYIVAFVMCILLVYVLVALFLWRAERKSYKRRHVIVLEDNYPNDRCPYLVVVFTSARFGAGSTAHVGFNMTGTKGSSRNHIFSCRERKVLQRNDDDWFVIFCQTHLGNLESLYIWHDNSGSAPDWYCDKIVVYDLYANTETLFIVEEWLALTEDEYPEAFVLTASEEDVKCFKSFFLYNFALGFRENHALVSCVNSHPRSQISKIQRLSIFVCGLMTAMLCSIMFYLPASDRQQWDDYHFTIGSRETVIALQTIVITVVVSAVVCFLFKKSYTVTYVRPKRNVRLRGSSSSWQSTASNVLKRKEEEKLVGSCYKQFVRIVTRLIRSRTLEPVQLPESKSVVRVHRVRLVIAWTVCVTIILISSYLTMLYGLRLGAAKSKEWLSSLLMSMGGEMLVFSPIRIIFMSTLMAAAFQNMYEVEVHKVNVKDIEIIEIPHDYEYLIDLLQRRSLSMYTPLRGDRLESMLARHMIKVKRLCCLELAISICVLVVVYYLIVRFWTSQYHSNKHAVDLLTVSHLKTLPFVDFDDIRNIQTLEEYLELTFVNALYGVRWYNYKPVDEDGIHKEKDYWAADFTNRMLGLPAVRQYRGVPVVCDSTIFRVKKCLPKFKVKDMDKDDYAMRWKPAMWTDDVIDSPWMFTDRESVIFSNYRLHTPSNRQLPMSGYQATLLPTKKGTQHLLADLRENGWLDERTRVVVTELCLYNVNERKVTHLTLIVEFLISGTALKRAYATALKSGPLLTLWNVLFLALITHYLVLCVYQMNRQGAVKYTSQLKNVCKLLIVVCGAIAILAVVLHHFQSIQYLKRYLSSGTDTIFHYDQFVVYVLLLRHALTVLLSVAILYTISMLRLGRHLLTNYYTLVLSLRWILWLSTVVFINIFILVCITIFCNIFMPYRTKNLIIQTNSLEELRIGEFEYLHVQILVIMKTVSITVCLWCFIIKFVHHFKLAKVYNVKRSDDFNMFLFILSHVKK